jgi:hypothetical protein
MALVTFGRPGSIPNPTQDQLEELETLIQRMLDLPVVDFQNSPRDSMASGARITEVLPTDLAGAALEQTSGNSPLFLVEHPAPPSDAINPSLSAPHFRITGSSEKSSGPGGEEPQATAGAEPSMVPGTYALQAADAGRAIRSPRSKPYSSRKKGRPQAGKAASITLLPFRAINWLFELYMLPFGPPGRWLRSTVAKNVLGVAGLILLATAGAFGLVEWMGWFN